VLHPQGVDLVFNFQQRERTCSIRKPNSQEFYQDAGAPFECTWKILRCMKNFWLSFPQAQRLKFSVITFLISAAADFLSDWIVFLLEITAEDKEGDHDTAWTIFAVLVVSALNSTWQAWEMFDHKLNYIVLFSFVGLGSFVFGVDLLIFGFGPIFWKLDYSPYAKFDQLRFRASNPFSQLMCSL